MIREGLRIKPEEAASSFGPLREYLFSYKQGEHQLNTRKTRSSGWFNFLSCSELKLTLYNSINRKRDIYSVLFL